MDISLAPFQGITNKVYRNAFARHFKGLDRVFAPFVSGVHPQKVNLSKFDDLLPLSANVITTVPQFVSIYSDEIVAIGNNLFDQGYDHINWNMGCPFSRLANKMRGCGILPYPEKIDRLMDEIFSRLKPSLSVKTRLGYYDTTELPQVIGVFNRYPIAELIIHARIGVQRYTGDTLLDEFGACMSLSKIPVTYNGDIFHATRFRELQEKFPLVKSWMVGRGALINPFLPAQIKGIEPDDQQKREAITGFHHEVFEKLGNRLKNERQWLGQMKAIWYYMNGVFAGGEHYFQSMKICHDRQSYLKFAVEMMQLPFAGDKEIELHWKHELKHV
ncbi:MAG: tRNA-dihydrouridine synthase [Bacteroidota bacterium]